MKVYKILFLLVCFGLTYVSQGMIDDPKELLNRYNNDNRIYLFSFPRSGNHWLRYCLQCLTGRQTYEHFPRENFAQLHRWVAFINALGIPVDTQKEIIWKVHFPYYFGFTGGYNLCKDRLIFILRDYKECLIRHHGHSVFEGEFLAKYEVFLYFQNLQFFHNWPQDKKIIVYYEDLVTNPQQTLKRILNFLEEDDALLGDFMSSYERHRAYSLLYYDKVIGKPVTLGKSIQHHAIGLSKEKKVEIDRMIAEAYPCLWANYLQDRYAERE